MKKMILVFSLAAAVVLFAGCVSVQTVRNKDLNGQALSAAGKPVAHVNVQNSGLYFLKWPIMAGSTDSVGSVSFFKDTVNPQSTVPVLTKEAKKLGATKVMNLTSQYSEFGLLFVMTSINVSGNAIKQ